MENEESVLEKELEVLREEARNHQQFLDRLRRIQIFRMRWPEKSWDMENQTNGYTGFQTEYLRIMTQNQNSESDLIKSFSEIEQDQIFRF